MRGQIKAKLMLIDSLAKEVERVESGMDLLALCGQFVAQVENALSDLAKRNAASFEVRKKVEVDIATLRQEIINETIKRQNAEAQVQAQQSVTDILKTDLSKLKGVGPEASTMNTIANLETLKSEFIDTLYQQLSEFEKKLADLPSHKSKRDDKMSAILSALDHPDNLSFRGSDQQSFPGTANRGLFLNMQNRDMDMSRHHRRDSNPSVTSRWTCRMPASRRCATSTTRTSTSPVSAGSRRRMWARTGPSATAPRPTLPPLGRAPAAARTSRTSTSTGPPWSRS